MQNKASSRSLTRVAMKPKLSFLKRVTANKSYYVIFSLFSKNYELKFYVTVNVHKDIFIYAAANGEKIMVTSPTPRQSSSPSRACLHSGSRPTPHPALSQPG